MLKIMRKYQRSWIIKVIFGAIIVSFVLFFGYSTWSAKEKPLAKVGSYEVGVQEFRTEYKKIEDMYKMIFKEKYDEKVAKEMKLKDKVLDQIVNSYLLMIAADEMGVKVGDDEFAEFLNSVEAFKKDGKFNKEQYQAVLRANKMDAEQFEASRKREMLLQKAASVIQDSGAYYNESDAWKSYVKEKGRVKLSYSVFEPAAFRGKVQVTDKELLDTYEKQKSMYRAENSYLLKVIAVDQNGSIKDDAVYMDLLKSKDIDAYGKSKGLAVISLGEMKEGELVKQYKGLRIEDLRDLKKQGELSRLVRSSDGKSYVFQLVNVTEGKDLDKTMALERIKEKIVSEKAMMLAKSAAEEAIKNKSPAPDKDTEFVSRTSQSINGVGLIPEDSKGLLGVTKEKPLYDKAVEVGNRFYVFAFNSEEQPDKQTWEKDKEAYTKYFNAKSREEYLKSYLTEMKSRVKVTFDDRQLQVI